MLIGNNNSKSSGKTTNGWELTRASVDGLVKAIESGRNEVFSSYLQTMARFPQYSARNVLLIAAQCPTASYLQGVRSWNELGRFVRPGEKGIFIFAPTVGIKNNSQTQSQAQDKDTGKKPAKGKKASEVTKEPANQPETQLLGFRGVYVFDGYVPLGPMPVLPVLFLATVIRQPASKKSGWLSIRLAPPRCSTSLRFGWTPRDCAAPAGARSKHGSRQGPRPAD